MGRFSLKSILDGVARVGEGRDVTRHRAQRDLARMGRQTRVRLSARRIGSPQGATSSALPTAPGTVSSTTGSCGGAGTTDSSHTSSAR